MSVQSGDIGYCMALRRTTSLIRTWSKGTVIDADCGYQTCGYADNCEMYLRKPVGYHSFTHSSDNDLR